MKHALRLFCTALVLASCNRQPKEAPTTLRLPITLKEGYGPFYPGFGILSADRPTDPLWGKTYSAVRGIPRHWSSPVKSTVVLHFQQFVYQHVKAGHLEQALYNTYSKAPGWTSDTSSLSTKPIKCYVNVVRGFDEHANKWAVLVDTDNDLDFSDETPVYPDFLHTKETDYKIKDQRIIQYELYRNGRVETARTPVVFRYNDTYFLYNFPRYATATAQVADKQYELLIDPNLRRLNFETSKIALASSIGSNGRIDGQKIVEIGDEIELGGIAYRNNGISFADNILELEPVNAETAATNPLQNGRVFQPFTEVEFSSGKPVALHRLKGKYVFVDFWGTWCKGCVEDMPQLNALYEQVDKNKVEFIGINCKDSPEGLRAFLQKHRTDWPQIQSTSANSLVDRYRVTSFPTSVLLDPSGTIIARDIHGGALKDKLAQLGL